MADFALWATACETALWPPGTFGRAYSGNRDDAVENVIDADPVATAVCAMMAARTKWTGTASDLLGALGEAAGETVRKAKEWPATPRALSGRLRRAAAFLRTVRIDIGFGREGSARTRMIQISSKPEEVEALPSAPCAATTIPSSIKEIGREALRTVGRTIARDADGRADGHGTGPAATVRDKPLKINGTDGADGTDSNVPTQSAAEKTMLQAGLESYECGPKP